MTEAGDVLRRLPAGARDVLDGLECFAELESTSTWLIQQSSPASGRSRAVIAEHQTAGRGRGQKLWLSPPSSGLCLSLAYTFRDTPAHFPALTLALGVGVVKALESAGAHGISLKWPNDLIAVDGKLGGILTEVHSGDHNGGSSRTVVVGVGINVDLPTSMRYAAPTSWTRRITDLTACMPVVPARAELAAAVLAALIDSITRFERDGFSAFQGQWASRDWLQGKTVRAKQAGRETTGVAGGVDKDGALLIHTKAGTERVISGSIDVPAYALDEK